MNYAPQKLLRPKELYFDIYFILISHMIEKETFGFSLSDTILFLENSPILWLFTSKRDKTIKRKNASRLNIKYILEKVSYFEKNQIVAYYVHNCEDDYNNYIKIYDSKEESENNANLNEFFSKIGVETENKPKIKKSLLLFEYFTKEDLTNFLTNKKKKQGVLQFYIQQRTNTNTMNRIIYNEKQSICEVRRSRQSVNKRSPHIYEKIITFETERFNIVSERVKSEHLETLLKDSAKQIIKIIENYYNNRIKIKSIILHFKEGTNSELYFQFCTGISFIEYEDENMKLSLWIGYEYKCELSENFNTSIFKNNYTEKEQKNLKTTTCLNCSKQSLSENFFDIPVSLIIDFYNHLRSLPAISQMKFERKNINNFVKGMVIKEYLGEINIEDSSKKNIQDKIVLRRSERSYFPMALRRLGIDEKKLTDEEIKILLNNKHFKNIKVKVCDECYSRLIVLNDPNNNEKSSLKVLSIPKKKIIFDVKREPLSMRLILPRENHSQTKSSVFIRKVSSTTRIPLVKEESKSKDFTTKDKLKKVYTLEKIETSILKNNQNNKYHLKTNSFKLPLNLITNSLKEDYKLTLSSRTNSMIQTSKTSARSTTKSTIRPPSKFKEII